MQLIPLFLLAALATAQFSSACPRFSYLGNNINLLNKGFELMNDSLQTSNANTQTRFVTEQTNAVGEKVEVFVSFDTLRQRYIWYAARVSNKPQGGRMLADGVVWMGSVAGEFPSFIATYFQLTVPPGFAPSQLTGICGSIKEDFSFYYQRQANRFSAELTKSNP